MTHEFYIRQAIQMVELKLKKIINENHHLLNALYRSVNHPLI